MKNKENTQGFVLLLVLWILIVVSVLAAAYFHLTSLEIQASRNDLQKIQARLLAEAAIELARATVNQPEQSPQDDLTEDWAGAGTLFEQTTLGEGIFQIYTADLDSELGGKRFGLRDEASKLNLNTASVEMLARLPMLTGEMVAAIVDWRDSDDQVSPGGAESEYYSGLSPSYTPRNGPFQSVGELMMVKEITPEILYGEDSNRDGLLQTAEDDGNENDPPDDGDGELRYGLVEYVTVYSFDRNVNSSGEPRLNPNTASSDEIAARLAGRLEEASIRRLVRYIARYRVERITQLLSGERTEELKKSEEVDSAIEGEEASAFRGADPESSGEEEEAGGEGIDSVTDEAELLDPDEFAIVLDELTLQDEETLPGLINVNTAPAEVLACIPGMTTSLMDSLLHRRDSELGGFSSVGELVGLEGMNAERFLEMYPHITVRSNSFEAKSFGYMPKTQAFAAVHAVFDRGNQGPVFRYYRILR